MAQSLANLLVHIVFSTKDRRPLLTDPDLRNEMHRYLAAITKGLECHALCIGGVEDHVHLLARQARTITLADWVKELKRGSSMWVKNKGPQLHDFQWQAGYAAFSVSKSLVERVRAYIARQEEHHRELTYQDELRILLEKHQVEYDERYIWD